MFIYGKCIYKYAFILVGLWEDPGKKQSTSNVDIAVVYNYILVIK